MDEPILHLRDGASVTTIPLTELLGMVDAAHELAEGALSGNPQAVAAADMVTRTATVYGPQRGKASVSMFLLQHAMAKIEQRKQASAIVVAPAAQQNVGAGPAQTAPAAAEPGAATPPVAAPATPCNHPPDIACPNCASAHQEARNAKKRQGARA